MAIKPICDGKTIQNRTAAFSAMEVKPTSRSFTIDDACLWTFFATNSNAFALEIYVFITNSNVNTVSYYNPVSIASRLLHSYSLYWSVL